MSISLFFRLLSVELCQNLRETKVFVGFLFGLEVLAMAAMGMLRVVTVENTMFGGV